MKVSQAQEQETAGIGQPTIIVSARGEGIWLTPGAFVAIELRATSNVRFVLERPDPDRFTVFVIVEDDPDETLDRIFDIERQLFARFPWTPFDLRVMKPGADWEPNELLKTTVLHFQGL